jgi:hypothetical protein
MKTFVDYVIQYKRGVEFMIHPQDIDLTNTQGATRLTMNDFRSFLDYIATAREAGTLEILTPSGLHYADANSNRRLDLMVDGKFTGLDAGAPATRGRWASSSWTGKTFPQTGGQSGGAYLSIDNSQTSTNSLVYQSISYLDTLGVRGETFMFQGYARSNGATPDELRLLIRSGNDGNMARTLVDSQRGNAFAMTVPTTTWTKVQFPFSVPADNNTVIVSLGKSGAAAVGSGIDWSDISVIKI